MAPPVSVWTALLESLHSALIDEINERLPKIKPELGLPVRQAKFAAPGETDQILGSAVDFGAAKGFAFLATDGDFRKMIKASPADFWKAVFARAGSEFARRQVQPKVGQATSWSPADPDRGVPELTRIVWIPIRISGASGFLGIGCR